MKQKRSTSKYSEFDSTATRLLRLRCIFLADLGIYSLRYEVECADISVKFLLLVSISVRVLFINIYTRSYYSLISIFVLIVRFNVPVRVSKTLVLLALPIITRARPYCIA